MTGSVLTWMRLHKVRTAVLVVCAVLLALWMLCLPRDLFKGTPYSSVVLSSDGTLLGARVASDGQWRFPPCDSVPERYASALIEFEDRRFRFHPGVDPLALGRAVRQNLSSGRVVSGGSTITMQVIRMSRGRDRTLWQKAVEAVLATRLEARCSKDEILALYASHAPFGGNVVGLQAAAWRYYGRSASDLSWGEAATLAVLPNSPSSIHVGRNREALLSKRNRLLGRLRDKGLIDATDYSLACEEPLPEQTHALPSHAFHLVERLSAEHPGESTVTSIDIGLQKKVEAVTDRWCREMCLSGIADLAAVVIDVHTGKTVAYVGNSDMTRDRPGVMVDVARAPRSTGSVLKPMLYCAALQDGDILPRTLLQDTPVNINGFTPQNFDLQYSGAVHADEALSRSLNIPSVHLLRKYGVPKFQDLLRGMGMTTLTRASGDYGLSLILGGGEGRLDELVSAYALMARYFETGVREGQPLTDRTAIWYTFEALSDVNRPDEIDWRAVSSVRRVAWKTGTSYGFRDGWAIGVTPDYAVGVWAGNAVGSGCPGLVGARTAGPVMFEIFNLLPASGWFSGPWPGEYVTAEVCPESGCLRGLHCPACDTVMLPAAAMRTEPCSYHRIVNMTPDMTHRVESPVPGSQPVTMFLLPPSMEWYYRERHPEYQPLPPLQPGTLRSGSYVPMEFIYPEQGSVLTPTVQDDGTLGGIVFSLAHSNPSTEVYWHIDSDYIGSTRYIHQMSITPEAGSHSVTVVDADGNSLSLRFEVAR